MTVSAVTNQWNYTGDGSTLPYAYDNWISATSDLKVYVDEVLQTITTDYTIAAAGVGVPGGGTVTFVSAPANLAVILIVRDVPDTQGVAYIEDDAFPASTTNTVINRLTVLVQQASALLARTLRLGVTDVETALGALPNKAGRLDKILSFHATTGDPECTITASTITSAAASATAAAASETNAASSASAAATSETNAATSETNAAASAAQLTGTSTTSLAIGTGSKVFTTQAGKFFDAGNWVLITSDADPTNFMHGQVTTYSSTTLTVNVTNTGGSGTLADWTIRASGTRGAVGATGATGATGPTGPGDVSGPGSSTDNALARFDGAGGKTLQDSGWTLNDSNLLLAGGQLSMADNLVLRPRLQDYAETTNFLSGTGNKTINIQSGNSVTHTAFGAITWTFSNPAGSPHLSGFTLSLITGGIGAQTWPTNVKWAGGTAPTLTSNTATFTTDFGVDEKLDITAHGFFNGERVHVTSATTLPAGLSADTIYFVINKTANDFELSTTLGGSAVNITDDGTGVHTLHSGEDKLVFETDNAGSYWIGALAVADAI